MTQPPGTVIVLWALIALACLTGIALGIREEGRWFSARDKRQSWRTLRLCTLPIAISTAGLVIIVTRSAGSPGTPIAFYASLLTLAPLAWFGLHWIAARWIEPRLSRGEIAWIGFSGLLILVMPPAVISGTQPWVLAFAGAIDRLAAALF